MNKKWILASSVPTEVLRNFREYDPVISQLLWNRGIISQKGIKSGRQEELIAHFLNPDFSKGLGDPLLFRDMEKAVSRIQKAIESNEKIAIWGDYDVDGTCATALLVETFKFLGKEVFYYIPHREDEGYGLNQGGIEELAKKGTTLIVTVDCGSKSFREIDEAKKLGIDVVITDHHLPDEKSPKAAAFINPKQKGCKYPFKDLSGVGVAYKLAQAILGQRVESGELRREDGEGFLKWQLDLVALGTIADIMPVLGENRVLVHYGLIVLSKTKRAGLQELFKISKLDPRDVSTYKIGFILGPRLNAAGRMESAKKSLELLLETNPKIARKIAMELDDLNKKRQELQEKLTKEARSIVLEEAGDQKIIVLAKENWPSGVLGLIASKLTDEFGKPSLVASKYENEWKGSARSISNFNIVEALESVSKYLVRFGGHQGAAGFGVKLSKISEFKREIEKKANKKIKDADLGKEILVDLEIDLENLTQELYAKIQEFEPFGLGNREPVFLAKNLEVTTIKLVGQNANHLKLGLRCLNSGKNYSAIGFGLVRENGHLQHGDKIDVVFSPTLNEWNGSRNIELRIIDLKAVKV